MGLDFWAVKIKKGVTKKDFDFKNTWDLIENKEVYDEPYFEKDIADFVLNYKDKDIYDLCMDFIGDFPSADPICYESIDLINAFADKLNKAIEENPTYSYKRREGEYYSNEDVRKFIKYINYLRDNGWVIWCSW